MEATSIQVYGQEVRTYLQLQFTWSRVPTRSACGAHLGDCTCLRLKEEWRNLVFHPKECHMHVSFLMACTVLLRESGRQTWCGTLNL